MKDSIRPSFSCLLLVKLSIIRLHEGTTPHSSDYIRFMKNGPILTTSILLVNIALLVSSCAPKVVTNIQSKSFNQVKPYESFAVLHSDSVSIASTYLLGDVSIKEKGLTQDCQYHQVLNLAKEEARKNGANVLMITEHKHPDYWSTCHRITANMYHVPNPRKYENTFEWHPMRKLVVEDFKASTESRPYQASLQTGMNYNLQPKANGTLDITVQNIAYTRLSYFKPTNEIEEALKQQQLYFDISEVYARKLFKALLEANLHRNNLEEANRILESIQEDYSFAQDQFASEVNSSPQALSEWRSRVDQQLQELSRYASKTSRSGQIVPLK